MKKRRQSHIITKSIVGFISTEVHQRHSFPGECQYYNESKCLRLVGLRWSEHAPRLHRVCAQFTGGTTQPRAQSVLFFSPLTFQSSVCRHIDLEISLRRQPDSHLLIHCHYTGKTWM